jgi:hypothetical protein
MEWNWLGGGGVESARLKIGRNGSTEEERGRGIDNM